ncbi:MAG: secretin N-terminal domain-containing protein [Planctomycetota bacterium]
MAQSLTILRGAFCVAVAAALGCTHANRVGGYRLQSEVGAKRPTVAPSIRQSPILDDLPIEELDSPWELGPTAVEANLSTPSPALSIGGEDRVGFDFRGSTLGEVIALIAETAQVNIVFDPALAQPVDASFPSVRIGEALYALLEQHDMELIEDPPGVYSVRSATAGGGRMRTFSLASLPAETAAAAVRTVLGDTDGATSTVVADVAQNLLFVRGTRSELEAVEAYLRSADQLERQVLVEVQILEAIIDENFELGVTHAIDGSIDGNALSIAQNLSSANAGAFNAVFDFDGGDISSTINALQSYVDLELISAPRVMTVSGAQATIAVIEEIPFVQATTSTQSDGGQAISAIEEVQFKEAGVTMDVTPTIQATGILKIVIAQELSEVVGQFQTIPILDKRTLNSEFLVADRQTIVLGGLMQDRRSDSENGVPVLKDIPLLGRLFRSDADETSKRELLVFVTPRIVDPNEAAVLARRYQSHFERKRSEYGMARESR